LLPNIFLNVVEQETSETIIDFKCYKKDLSSSYCFEICQIIQLHHRMRNVLGLLVFLQFFFTTINAQNKKSVEALRITTPLTIDGVLDEPVYGLAKPAIDFFQLEPYNGKPAMQSTEVRFFFDESAIYVGAMLYDSAPDSIFNFLTERDNIGMSDFFGVYFDPFNEGQLGFGFFITPSGVQVDVKATKNNGGGDNEDDNWNAVWESKTKVTDKGWVLEMRIPFSELRFSNTAGNTWGLNMFRNLRRYNSNNSWSFIDRKIEGFIDQQGHLTGIENIDPPVRLSLSPYLATYLESSDESKDNNFLYKGGLDLKYGINESFTLDMMLIPDFGQIQSDDKKLNLSPYEIYYSEKRQFFTESTELFERAGIFYSRRIGANPKFSGNVTVEENESIDYSPVETQLINATKVSGRSDKGWGLGFLNAMSMPSYTRIKNSDNGETRKVLVQPFTNYNVSVVDKSLKNNSYISVINTNMSMADHPFRANVTATDFQFRNKSKTYVLSGNAAMSVRGERDLETGFSGFLSGKKNKGNFVYGLENRLFSDTYNPNDLGFLQNNNSLTTSPWVYYQIIEPFSIFRNVNGSMYWDYNRIYQPNVFFKNKRGYELNAQFRNNYYFKVNGGFQSISYDYFEPRVKGRFYKAPRTNWCNFNLNTDSRKDLFFYFYYGFNSFPDTDQFSHMREMSAVYRVGYRFRLEYNGFFNNSINEKGFVEKNEANDSILFSRRDVFTFSNVLYASYVFNNKASLSLRGRHYWSGVGNKDFYFLQKDGTLLSNPSYLEKKDLNYNAFTIDMTFRWVFAPGSEFVLALKNAAHASKETLVMNYWKNLEDSWSSQSNSLSLKVLYYIDYHKLKRK